MHKNESISHRVITNTKEKVKFIFIHKKIKGRRDKQSMHFKAPRGIKIQIKYLSFLRQKNAAKQNPRW